MMCQNIESIFADTDKGLLMIFTNAFANNDVIKGTCACMKFDAFEESE